jgi:DNA-binding LacI/PurR family transcriptional regulator
MIVMENDDATITAALEAIFDLPQPPTALLAQSDRTALVAIRWLKARGLRVPEDVSVVGFDGIDAGATSDPPLTTVAQPMKDIGRRAVEMILGDTREVRRETLPLELIVRASTAPPPPG